MEGIRPEWHAANVVRRIVGGGVVTVAAMRPFDRLCLDLERLTRECPIGDDGGPPAGDRITPQLEHGGIVPDALRHALPAPRQS